MPDTTRRRKRIDDAVEQAVTGRSNLDAASAAAKELLGKVMASPPGTAFEVDMKRLKDAQSTDSQN